MHRTYYALSPAYIGVRASKSGNYTLRDQKGPGYVVNMRVRRTSSYGTADNPLSMLSFYATHLNGFAMNIPKTTPAMLKTMFSMTFPIASMWFPALYRFTVSRQLNDENVLNPPKKPVARNVFILGVIRIDCSPSPIIKPILSPAGRTSPGCHIRQQCAKREGDTKPV